jgi:hypothetical protein
MMLWLALLSALAAGAEAVTFTVPSRAGEGGLRYGLLDPAPVGISFEFFAFPSYFTNVTATQQCLANWRALTGAWPPIRIGGTTQDRASFDAKSSAYVVYSVASPADAPKVLTFGPKFMTLAGTYPGSVVVGLNRGKNNLPNTIEAAKAAVGEVKNLLAIELGNEPECETDILRVEGWNGADRSADYPKDGQPIGQGTWNQATDAASQNNWAVSLGTAVGRKSIIQAGNRLENPATWGPAQLIATQNSTVREYVHNYAHHNYPGGSVTSLMSHSGIASNVRRFDADVAATARIGKQYVLGETNSGKSAG